MKTKVLEMEEGSCILACDRARPIGMYYPVPLTGSWVSHIFLSIADGLASCGWNVVIGSVYCNPAYAKQVAVRTMPSLLYRGMCKLGFSDNTIRGLQHRLFYRATHGYMEIAYLWPGTPAWMYQKLRNRGIFIVTEMINCHVKTSSRILQSVYREEGMEWPNTDYRKSVEDERMRLELSDAIFSPSPSVTSSLIEHGVPTGKILNSSYGYSEDRIIARVEKKAARFTFLFVGSGILRKGLHILLRAWRRMQQHPYRLMIAGHICPEIAARYADVLSQSSVKVLGHVSDVNEVFEQSDVFVFPTFEEGSPLVVYEALAAGLPVVTTPMGAGDVVRDGVEGIVVDYYDDRGLVQAMEILAADKQLREGISRNAVSRSSNYSWSKVAGLRSRQIREIAT